MSGAEAPETPVELRLCAGLSCALMGASALGAALARDLPAGVRVRPVRCQGRCDKAPVAAIGHVPLEHATEAAIAEQLRSSPAGAAPSVGIALADYENDGGYHLYRTCLAGARTPDDVIGVIEASGLTGLGGDATPIGPQWRALRAHPEPRHLVLDALDAGAGSFKDRKMLERDPHRVLEGALIAAWASGATAIFVALRDEYAALYISLGREIAALEAAGLAAATRLHLRRTGSGDRCGDVAASIAGLDDQSVRLARASLVHGVEELAWMRDILERGGAWFAGQGRHGAKGLRAFSVSGRVKEPGLKLAPAGITMNELLDAYCEGMAEGHRFGAYLVGGARGRILPATAADLPLDDARLRTEGVTLGAGTIVVLSDRDDLDAAARLLRRSLETESPGVG